MRMVSVIDFPQWTDVWHGDQHHQDIFTYGNRILPVACNVFKGWTTHQYDGDGSTTGGGAQSLCVTRLNIDKSGGMMSTINVRGKDIGGPYNYGPAVVLIIGKES